MKLRRFITQHHYGQYMATESFDDMVRKYRKLTPATEDVADGRINQEIEYVIYARITDFEQLSRAASVEEQEQWEVRVPKVEGNAAKGGIRVRKQQVKGGDPIYTLTTKVKGSETAKGASQNIEITIPTNEDNFTQFKFLASVGMLKHRYRFPVVGTDLVWEVDVFPNGKGGYHEWVKMDLEVKGGSESIPELPLYCEETIMPAGYSDEDPAERDKKIWQLYDICFFTKNQFLKKVEERETAPSSEVPEEPKQETQPTKPKPQPATKPKGEAASDDEQQADGTKNDSKGEAEGKVTEDTEEDKALDKKEENTTKSEPASDEDKTTDQA